MKDVEIKEVSGDEIDPLLEMVFYAFFSTPGDIERLLKNKHYFKEDLCYAIYEDDKPVSGLMLKPILQNVRGTIKKMCGVAEVVTDPEARRKGYAKKLMDLSFKKMKEKEQVFSTLYPFKEEFYERLGYVSFPQLRTAVFSPQSLVPLIKEELDGTVERINIKEGMDVYLDYIKKFQLKIHGMGIKHDTEQARMKDEATYWLAIAKKNNGEVIGIMTYKITGFWKEIKIRHFYFNNSQGKYLLLQWLAHHADQVNEIHLPILPGDFPEIWFNDTFWGSKGKIVSREWVPSPMGRVVIVDQISGIHVGEGSISMKIKDEQCEWNNKTYLFENKDGILNVNEIEHYDCELTIQGLSAIIFGCYNLDDFPFKKWGDLSEENKLKIKKLFPQKLPHLHADF
ncbi:MAG: GNAT family N-acetyltransferase [Candidatus Heimdallarchaeaceae archaeon]